jgi:hypothetical protein
MGGRSVAGTRCVLTPSWSFIGASERFVVRPVFATATKPIRRLPLRELICRAPARSHMADQSSQIASHGSSGPEQAGRRRAQWPACGGWEHGLAQYACTRTHRLRQWVNVTGCPAAGETSRARPMTGHVARALQVRLRGPRSLSQAGEKTYAPDLQWWERCARDLPHRLRLTRSCYRVAGRESL